MSQARTDANREPIDTQVSHLDREPYVGPRSFTADDALRFFGREYESKQLSALLISERIVVLHGPLGTGKTSLINARVSKLLASKLEVLPTIRLNYDPVVMTVPDEPSNRYVESTLRSLGWTPVANQPLPTLLHFLNESFAEDQRAEVMIFDQFEEVLTLCPTDSAQKNDFFRQLGDVLDSSQHPDNDLADSDSQASSRSQPHPRWALFVVRDEQLASLDPFLPMLGASRPTMFRLRPLDATKATAAIRGPAERGGVEITEDAAEWLFRKLSGRYVYKPGTKEPTWIEGHQVEPVHLQIVCQRFWEALPPGQMVVTQEDAERALGYYLKKNGSDPVDAVLADYYSHELQAIERNSNGQIRERELRYWIDRYLISSHGVRIQVAKGNSATNGLSNQAIDALRGAHLVQEDDRTGVSWIELSHDRLIRPIQISNESWLQENTEPWQLAAVAWERSRTPNLLLRWRALKEAEKSARKNPEKLAALDKEFLHESRKTWNRRLARNVLIGTVTAVVGAALLFALRGRHLARIAEANNLAITAGYVTWEEDSDKALLQAYQAWQNHPNQSSDQTTRKVMIDLLSRSGGKILHGHNGPINQITLNEAWIITGSQDDTVRLWNREKIELAAGTAAHDSGKHGHKMPVLGLVTNAKLDRLASVSVDKTARIWNIQKNVSDAEFYNGAVLGDGTFPNSTLLRAAFFADDKWVCAVGITGDVYFWPVPAESSKDPLPPYIAGGVHRGRIAVLQPYKRPEDKKFPIMATAGHDGTVRIWDLFKLAEKLNVLDSPGRGASELVSSIINDVSYVIQTNRDARNNAEINDVDFYERNLADGRKELWLISAGGDGELRFINLATIDHDRGPSQSRAVDLSAQNHFVGDGHRNAIVDIAIRQDKHLLLTGGSDGKVYVWNLSDLIDKWQPTEMVEHRNASQELSGHSSSITDITLTVDGQWAITSGDDNFVRIWSLSSKTAAKKPADYEICLPNRVGVLSVVPKSVHDQVGAVVSGDLLVVGCDDELVRVWKFSNRDRSWLDWEQKNLYTKLPQKIDPTDAVAQRQNAGSAASSDPSGSRREMLEKKSNQELAELCRELVSLHWGKEAVEEWLDTH